MAQNAVERTKQYLAAKRKWKKAGRPVRSQGQMQTILEEKCKPCEHYIATGRSSGRCGLCGCKLNLTGKRNKLLWGTEKCPIGKWEAMTAVDTKPEQTDQLSRAERRRQRRAARAKRRSREAPEIVQLPKNEDPLLMYDRHKNPIGHVFRDMWAPCPGFLVCGGPSLKTIDLNLLKQRGVVSLGVNNVAGLAPVTAFTFSDPPEKFHHGIFFDGRIKKFVPTTKLYKRVRAKKPDGTFAFTSFNVSQCPEVYAYSRNATWEPERFLTSEHATWGNDKAGAEKTGKPKILFTFFLGLRLMHYFGCPRVYLLGADFAMDERHKYAFAQGRTTAAQNGNNNSYRIAAQMCKELRPVLDRAGWHVYQTNPNSRLTAFDYVPFEVALRDCKQFVPDEPFSMDGWYDKPGEDEDDRGTS